MYGGAFAHGNASTSLYGIDRLIEQDMVLVTFNYRIGIFGRFLQENNDQLKNIFVDAPIFRFLEY